MNVQFKTPKTCVAPKMDDINLWINKILLAVSTSLAPLSDYVSTSAGTLFRGRTAPVSAPKEITVNNIEELGTDPNAPIKVPEDKKQYFLDKVKKIPYQKIDISAEIVEGAPKGFDFISQQEKLFIGLYICPPYESHFDDKNQEIRTPNTQGMLNEYEITPEMAAQLCALYNASLKGLAEVAKQGVTFAGKYPPNIRFYMENGLLSVEPDLSYYDRQ